jgi:hypothetical protein
MNVKLHPLERKLIESLRRVGDGTIDKIKIQDGLPVIFNMTLEPLEIFPDRMLDKL